MTNIFYPNCKWTLGKLILRIILCWTFIFTPFLNGHSNSSSPNLKSQNHSLFASYGPFKKQLISYISRAKHKIILANDFISDGDIVSSLYLAKYRGISVKVVLGYKKANHYLSRIRFLHNNKIATYVLNIKKLPFPHSFLQVDRQIFKIEGTLHEKFLGQSKYSITKSSKEKIPSLEKFIGKLKPQKKRYISLRKPKIPARSNGKSYNYDPKRKQYRAPKGITTKLPQTPIYSKKNGINPLNHLPDIEDYSENPKD